MASSNSSHKSGNAAGGTPLRVRNSPSSFEVRFETLGEDDGSTTARIRPVADVDALLGESGFRLADGILDIVSDLVAELAREEMEDAGTEVLGRD
jgi:hypothetical protein